MRQRREQLAQLVEAEVATLTGDSIRGAVRVPGYFLNATFIVDGDSGGYVLKCCESGRAAEAEAGALEIASGVGIACPRVLALEPSGGRIGSAYFVMTHLTGRPAEATSRAWFAVGRSLRTLHQVRVEGFGWLGLTGDVRRGPFSNWRDHVLERASRIQDVARAGLISDELADGALALIDRHAGVFECPEPRLLHGDVDERHVLVDGGRLSGIIDWGDVSAGDPLFDLGRILRTTPVAIDAVLDGYGPTGWTGEALRDRLEVYASVMTASEIVGRHEAGAGDQLQPATAELTDRLALD